MHVSIEPISQWALERCDALDDDAALDELLQMQAVSLPSRPRRDMSTVRRKTHLIQATGRALASLLQAKSRLHMSCAYSAIVQYDGEVMYPVQTKCTHPIPEIRSERDLKYWLNAPSHLAYWRRYLDSLRRDAEEEEARAIPWRFCWVVCAVRVGETLLAGCSRGITPDWRSHAEGAIRTAKRLVAA